MTRRSDLENRVASLERGLESSFSALQRANHNARALEVMLCTLIDHSCPDDPKKAIDWLDAMEETALRNIENLIDLAADQMIRDGASREMVAAYERQREDVSFIMKSLYTALRKPREMGGGS